MKMPQIAVQILAHQILVPDMACLAEKCADNATICGTCEIQRWEIFARDAEHFLDGIQEGGSARATGVEQSSIYVKKQEAMHEGGAWGKRQVQTNIGRGLEKTTANVCGNLNGFFLF